MERLTQPQLRVLLGFVRGFYACHDRDAFVSYLLYGIATLIPAELAACVELDGEGRVIDMRTEPSVAEFPDFRQLFERYLRQHPHFTYHEQADHASAIKLSDFLTRREFHTRQLYRELYRPMRMEYVMSIALSDARPGWTMVVLHRSRRDFSERDRLLLNLLRSHLVQAYANAESVRVLRQEIELLGQAMETKGQGIILLTKDGRVRLVTERARRWLVEYFGHSSQHADRLSQRLGSLLAHQETSMGVTDDALPSRKPLMVKRKTGCLVVRHLCEADRCILLMEEQCQARESVSLRPLGLTSREAEVLSWVSRGKTNAEIGEILGLSSRTVQKHLEHIFRKLGVETRVAAARTLALGTIRKW